MRRSKVAPDAPLRGEITLPGDKSISHRALILGALATGRSRISNLGPGDDVGATRSMLGALGARWVATEDNAEVKIDSLGADALREPEDVLDAGNSGTSLRVLLGVAAPVRGAFVFTGDASLRRRPMLRVVAPLRQMGAHVDGRAFGDLPPLFLRGAELSGGDFDLAQASAQVKTAILLAGLRARGTTSVTEPAASRDHTERMLRAADVPVQVEGSRVEVRGGATPEPRNWRVPGDPSSAMFLLVAAALLPGSDLVIRDVALNPTRLGGLEVLRTMGGDIEIEQTDEWGGEPVGNVRVRHSALRGAAPQREAVPSFVDEVPVLAAAATQADGETVFSGIGELRVKESDRIAAVTEALGRLGGEVEAHDDVMVVRGPSPLRGGEVDSHGDHRVALALAVAGLVADGNVRVTGWSCINTSFPGFLDVLASARARK